MISIYLLQAERDFFSSQKGFKTSKAIMVTSRVLTSGRKFCLQEEHIETQNTLVRNCSGQLTLSQHLNI